MGRLLGAALMMLGALAACGDDGENLSPFCREVLETEQDAADEVALGEALQDLDAAVPEEIEEAWDLVLANWDQLIDDIDTEELATDDTEEAEALAEHLLEIETSWRIVDSYLRDVCAIDL